MSLTPPIAPRRRFEADAPRSATPTIRSPRGPVVARRARGSPSRPSSDRSARRASPAPRRRTRPPGPGPSIAGSRPRSRGSSLRPCARRSSATQRNSSPRSVHCSRHVVMSRLNPWEKRRRGASGGPAAPRRAWFRRTPRSARCPRAEGPRGVATGRAPASPERCPARPAATAPAAAAAPTRHPGWRARHPSRHRVSPRHPFADPAHDLVPDRPEQSPERVRADRLVPLAPDQHDLLADLDLPVAAVHHQLIHRDRPRDPAAAPPDQHLAHVRQLPRVAVRVADRHRGDPGVPFQPVAMAVGRPRPPPAASRR